MGESGTPIELDAIEQRVLGSLLEKQRTVPATYPLSLNALRMACNQTTSRDPLTSYDERTIIAAIDRLKGRGLVRTVWTGGGSRVLKFHQLLDEVLSLQPEERALLTVLLLRGPQSAGELRTRTERLFGFEDKLAVEARLHSMAALPTPMVRERARRPGQQDPRWIHLLGPVESEAAATGETDREVVLAHGVTARNAAVVAGYDAVASAYAEQLRDELQEKPFDCWLLDRMACLAAGPVADVGCGPGQVAGYLAEAGAAVSGFDLSPGMVAQAQAEHPEIPFEVADLTRLLRPRDAAGWAGIAAWYSLVHLAPSELPAAVTGLARTLAVNGWLMLAVQLGADVRHLDELMGTAVDLDVVLHDRDDVLAAVHSSGLVEVEWYVRSPYAGVETGTDRLYVVARRRA
ncbi:MAG: DUF480 domain-containing protein [Propionicimonas sp.]